MASTIPPLTTPLNTPIARPRRNRKTEAIRRLVAETELRPRNLVLPLFLREGTAINEPIATMPGVSRLSADRVIERAKQAADAGIAAIALFPVIADDKKNARATESTNPDGLLQTTVRRLKDAVPQIAVITDVAMDPYSSDGHDGLVEDGKVVNDATLEILAQMAVSQAQAGADIVAPSDMMDGRVRAIREALDAASFQDTSILAYSAKYASAFYGPFRDALDSAPRHGDKKTYQMDRANAREAIREVSLDIEEGADIVMVKPALSYLDVIAAIRQMATVPVAAYSVSGEYAMIAFAAQAGCVNRVDALLESTLSIKRAGADIIFTYAALELANLLRA